jgi:hypothetical protein
MYFKKYVILITVIIILSSISMAFYNKELEINKIQYESCEISGLYINEKSGEQCKYIVSCKNKIDYILNSSCELFENGYIKRSIVFDDCNRKNPKPDDCQLPYILPIIGLSIYGIMAIISVTFIIFPVSGIMVLVLMHKINNDHWIRDDEKYGT